MPFHDIVHEDYEYVRELNQWDYFGEVALMNNSGHRTTQVLSVNYCNLLGVPSQVFFALCADYPLFGKLLRNRMNGGYDDKIFLMLIGFLRQVPYLTKAKYSTLAKIAYSMRYIPFKANQALMVPDQITREMFIIMDGRVEVVLEFKEHEMVVEKFSRGSVINPFNFIVEELCQTKMVLRSRHSSIYSIQKSRFLEIISSDKHVKKELLKFIMD